MHSFINQIINFVKMKHPIKITLILVGMFIVSQFLGLWIINHYIDRSTGTPTYKELPYGLAPPPVNENYGFIFIIVGVLIGTGAVLLLIKFRKIGLWKVWFFLSALVTMGVAFSAFVNQWVSIVLSAILAFFKVFRPNLIVHNVTELLIYGGLAAIFVPILNVFAVVMLLIIISIYDAYAVWHSKHMVKMARFQAESKIFAGFLIPKGKVEFTKPLKKAKEVQSTRKPSVALLGGGDVAFPLLFSGVVLKTVGFVPELFVIALCTAVALLALLYYGEQGKFYPAMPFLSAGTFIGYGIFLLLQSI